MIKSTKTIFYTWPILLGSKVEVVFTWKDSAVLFFNKCWPGWFYIFLLLPWLPKLPSWCHSKESGNLGNLGNNKEMQPRSKMPHSNRFHLNNTPDIVLWLHSVYHHAVLLFPKWWMLEMHLLKKFKHLNWTGPGVISLQPIFLWYVCIKAYHVATPTKRSNCPICLIPKATSFVWTIASMLRGFSCRNNVISINSLLLCTYNLHIDVIHLVLTHKSNCPTSLLQLQLHRTN